jgi:galactosyltransferase
VYFFSGKPQQNVFPMDDCCEDIVYLDCPDTYEHLSQKTLGLIDVAAEYDYDLLIKCDSDIYFLPLYENISEFLNYDCLGSVRVNPPWNQGIPYAQGGCYSLSKRAMVEVLKQRSLFTTGIEDGAIGKALHSANIRLSHSGRIKTNYRQGYPCLDNDNISAHGCTPETLHAIHECNLLHLLSAYNQMLQNAQ